MTIDCLNQDELQTVEIITALGFGVIEHLTIRNGLPCFEHEPRIVQAIKLDSDPNQKLDAGAPTPPLKKEFENLFDHFRRLGDGHVDIEVRHGLPFRLIREWPSAHSPIATRKIPKETR